MISISRNINDSYSLLIESDNKLMSWSPEDGFMEINSDRVNQDDYEFVDDFDDSIIEDTNKLSELL